MATVGPGRVAYTVWCDDQGQVIDDGTIFHLKDGEYRLCSQERHMAWLTSCAIGFDVTIVDETHDVAAAGIGLPIRGREVSMWLALLHQGGGFFFRNDKEAMFAEKPGVDAAQFIRDIYDKHKISSRTSLNANEAFGQGKAPFLYNWTWYIGTLKTSFSDTNFETRLLPTPTGKGVSVAVEVTVAVGGGPCTTTASSVT